jgi:hypothetical protein
MVPLAFLSQEKIDQQIQQLPYSHRIQHFFKEITMFEIPAEFQDKLKNAMKDESGIKLPFAAPTLWWMNGKPALKNTKEVTNPTRFGGWGISKDEIDDIGEDWPEIPPHWELHNLTNDKGGDYSAYLTRQAWVAPIARRYRWFDGKSQTNILCYLGVMTKERVLLPHGPVVLSVKSLTGLDLDKCFKEFAAKTTQIRNKALPNYFWHPIGTWQPEPVFVERKSKSGHGSSSVTPPQLYTPKDGFTAETLQKWFVQVEVVAEMVKLYEEAHDWLADWNQRKSDPKPGAEPNPFGEPEPEFNQDTDFPF